MRFFSGQETSLLPFPTCLQPKNPRNKPSSLIESSLFTFTNVMRMKLIPSSLSILLAAGIGMANAATVIGDGVGVAVGTGGADGWSGISVLESAVIDSTTEGGGQLQATSVSIQAQRVGTNHFIPLLVNSANEIAWIGPQLTPTVAGLNTFAITGADPIDASGGDLRLGVWQWNEGVNNSNGGTITFGNGGGGMFQMDVDGTQGAAGVSLGMAVTSGHASGAGGRDYNVDLTVAPLETADSDGDGLPDSWETANNLDPDDNGEDPNNNGIAGDPDQGADGDPDSDGLTNLEELVLHTDPQENDTDMDGLLDGVESNTGTWNGADDTGTDPTNADSDDDGLSDGVENPDLAHNRLDPSQQPGTDPNLADTDGDGKDDSVELADGTDPTNTNDVLVPTGVLVGDGAERPFATGGGADGWSGVSVLESVIIDDSTLPGAGNLVEVLEVSMLAAGGRHGGTHHFMPLLIDSSNQIAWIGPELTPTQVGHNVFPITGADPIDVSADTYRLGVWQWNDGVNNSSGGTIAFGNGGGGMFQQDIDGTLGAGGVSIGHEVTTGHSSGAGGRDYHIDVLVGTSEPEVIILTDVSSDPGAGTISLSWESKAGKLYNLRSEADPAQIAGVVSHDWPIFGGNADIAATPPENTLTIPMPDDLTRLFVVEGFPAPPVTLFTDDLESGAEGWTTVVNDAIGSTRWELGSPSGSTGPLTGADDSATAWCTNLGDYGPNSDISLRSPAFDLSGVASAELTFKAFRDADGFGDSAVVRFLRSADLLQLGAETALDMTVFDVDYTTLEVPVPTEALGENVIIEWNFVSDGSADNFSGLSIDDIEVIE